MVLRNFALFLVAALATACQQPRGLKSAPSPTPGDETPRKIPAPPGRLAAPPPGTLRIEELAPGSGQVARPGNTVAVHYTGRLLNGAKFDSSLDRGQPIEFVLGKRMVIQGWDQGIEGMRVGGKRKLTIPPHLAYGASGAGEKIPPNSTLVFEVELTGLR